MAMKAIAAEQATRRDAFESLVRSHQRRLFVISRAIVRDAGEAEDAVQDSFMVAWRKWDSVRDEERRPAWLTTICVRLCLRRRVGLMRRMVSEPDVSAAAADDVRFQGRLLDLDRAQARLSRQQRAALVLTYHHGYSADQCAELMGVAPGTVRSHLARALATLRKEMTDV